MTMMLTKIREKQRQKVLLYRSIERLINKPIFGILWEESDFLIQWIVADFINDGDKDEIINWITNHKSLSYEDRNISHLKSIARKLQIKNWSRLSKYELIRAIQQKELGNEKTGHGDGNAGNDKGNGISS